MLFVLQGSKCIKVSNARTMKMKDYVLVIRHE